VWGGVGIVVGVKNREMDSWRHLERRSGASVKFPVKNGKGEGGGVLWCKLTRSRLQPGETFKKRGDLLWVLTGIVLGIVVKGHLSHHNGRRGNLGLNSGMERDLPVLRGKKVPY